MDPWWECPINWGVEFTPFWFQVQREERKEGWAERRRDQMARRPRTAYVRHPHGRAHGPVWLDILLRSQAPFVLLADCWTIISSPTSPTEASRPRSTEIGWRLSLSHQLDLQMKQNHMVCAILIYIKLNHCRVSTWKWESKTTQHYYFSKKKKKIICHM